MMQSEIIRRPVITEKTSIQKEIANQLTFEVDRRANRIEIKRAIETAFKVKVTSVKTMQVKGKVKRRGRNIGKRRWILDDAGKFHKPGRQQFRFPVLQHHALRDREHTDQDSG